jgi:hypothetical protein
VQLLRLDGRPGTTDLPVLFLDRDVGAVRQSYTVLVLPNLHDFPMLVLAFAVPFISSAP